MCYFEFADFVMLSFFNLLADVDDSILNGFAL